MSQPQYAPKLDRRQEEQTEKVASIPAPVLHETIRAQGDEELSRSVSALAWSGLAAGLSMGFSLIAEGVLSARLPDASWAPLIAKLGYSFGFLIVIVGRQQLFTENTLTAVLPVLVRRDLATFGRMLRLWTIVLITNVIGAWAVAHIMAGTDVFTPEVRGAFVKVAGHALEAGFGTVLLRGIFAGWLIATLVWTLPAVRRSQIFMIILMTWLVSAGNFTHIVAGSVDVLYLLAEGRIGWPGFFAQFFLPTLIGNVIGGVSLVAVLNHAQVVAGNTEPSEEDETTQLRAA